MAGKQRKNRRKSGGAQVPPVRGPANLFAYDSDELGICVGVPLSRNGDVLLLYEAGYFCAWVKNMSGIRREQIPMEQFLPFFNTQLEHGHNLQRIRSILNEDSGCEKTHPSRFLEGLFAKRASKKVRRV